MTTFKSLDRPQIEIDVLAFLVGLFSLLVQVTATHFTFLTQAQSSYAIGLSLFSFLTGMAIAARMVMQQQEFLLKHFRSVIAFTFSGVGIYFALVTHFESLWRGYLDVLAVRFFHNPETGHIFVIFTLSLMYLFLPALALGLIFPLINDRRTQVSGSLTGRTSSLDYIGAGLGCLLASFYLIPSLGLDRSAFVIGAVLLATSLVWHSWSRRIPVAAVLALAIGWQIYAHTQSSETLFSENSPYGNVTVTLVGNHRMLAINGRTMCSNDRNRSERYLGKVALDVHSRGELNTLNVGLGCGYTANEMKTHVKTKRLTVVEINPKVIQANSHFATLPPEWGVTIKNMDGFGFLKSTPEVFDVIAVDVEEPSIVHSSPLFTLEFFELAKSKMKTDGVFSLWSFYQVETARIILNTLRRSFKYAEVISINKNLVYVASDRPMGLAKATTEKKRVKKIYDLPMNEIATLAANPYPKYFRIKEIFKFGEDHKDIFEIPSQEFSDEDGY